MAWHEHRAWQVLTAHTLHTNVKHYCHMVESMCYGLMVDRCILARSKLLVVDLHSDVQAGVALFFKVHNLTPLNCRCKVL